MTSGYMAVLIFFHCPDALSGGADPVFALVITQGSYLHHVQLAKLDSANNNINNIFA